MVLKILSLRHCLQKAPCDQMKFENKEPCFQLHMVSYEKVYPGQGTLEGSKEKAMKRTSAGMQEEGKGKADDVSLGACSTAHG